MKINDSLNRDVKIEKSLENLAFHYSEAIHHSTKPVRGTFIDAPINHTRPGEI